MKFFPPLLPCFGFLLLLIFFFSVFCCKFLNVNGIEMRSHEDVNNENLMKAGYVERSPRLRTNDAPIPLIAKSDLTGKTFWTRVCYAGILK